MISYVGISFDHFVLILFACTEFMGGYPECTRRLRPSSREDPLRKCCPKGSVHASFCFSGNCLRVEALSNGDMGRRLPNQAGSTIPDIVTGDPSPEDDRGGHAGEILQIDARKMILLPGSFS